MDKESSGPVLESKEAREHRLWQKKLLPVMVKMVIGLTIFFFAASFIQLFYLHSHISNSEGVELKPVMPGLESAATSENARLDAARWASLLGLEQYALQRRYHQANVLLMARVWTRYLGFVTGMISSLVGSIFILGKLQEPPSALSGDASAWKFSLTTSSPGIVLAVLGTILMVTTLVVPARIEVEDKATFVGTWLERGHSLQLPEEILKELPSNTKTSTTAFP